MPSTSTADYSQVPDSELVSASLQGQKEAFGVIVTRYQGLVTGMLYNRCRGDILQSEELAQQTFVSAWQNLSKLRDTHKLSSWLCGIARNVQRNAQRQKRDQTELDPTMNIASTAAEPSEAAITREQERILWQSLEQIPEKYREPMVLFYRQDQSVAEVAKALDEKEATIRKRLERGRSMLRDQVAQVVEDTLRSSGPSAGFAIGVLAALPMFTGKASAATLGAGTAGTAAGGWKLLALVPHLIGPVVGLWGGIYGTMNSLCAARSSRERRFIIRSAIALTVGIGLFLVCLFTLNYFRRSIEPGTHGSLMATLWITYATVLTAGIIYLNRRQAQIRIADGTATNVRPDDRPPRWSTKQDVYGSLGGMVFGSIAWIVVTAAQAADWLWATSTLVLSVLIYVWCAQTVIRQGPSLARRSVLSASTVIVGLYALTVNMRLNTWLATEAENGLSFGNAGMNVTHVPLWAANLVVIAVGVALFVGTYALTKPSKPKQIVSN